MEERTDSRGSELTELRRRAEEAIRSQAGSAAAPPTHDAEPLVHELEVHQVELEMQNRQLRETQQELEASRNRYWNLYEFAPVGYVILDANGHIQDLNLTASTMLGRERSRLLRHPFVAYVAKDDKNVFLRHLRACIQHGESSAAQVNLVSEHGHEVPVQLQSLLVEDPASPGTLCRLAVVDITALTRVEEALRGSRDTLEKRVETRTRELVALVGHLGEEVDRRAEIERELRASEMRYQLIAAKVNDVIWTASVSCPVEGRPLSEVLRLTYVSPAIERLTGYTVEEATQLPMLQWLSPASAAAAGQLLEQRVAGRSEEAVICELEIVAKDGSPRWCEITANAIWSPDGELTGIVGIARDISERRRLEQEISQVSTREQQAVGKELHDGLAQEILGIGLIAKGLQRGMADQGTPQAEAVGKLVDMLREAQKHVYALVKGVRPVEVDAEGLMAALADLAAGTEALGHVRCEFKCERPVAIHDDHAADQLFHIAQEAVRNAVKHAHARRITIGLANEGPLCLWIRDDGVGIPLEANLQKGLGLRIMRHRAALVGAALQVRRAEEGGTLVSCTLCGAKA